MTFIELIVKNGYIHFMLEKLQNYFIRFNLNIYKKKCFNYKK
jgi:hypothetical protein